MSDFSRAYALSGSNLVSFDPSNPTVGNTIGITGLTTGDTLVGIDFRPQNGLLYGLGVNTTSNTATLYAVSTQTGQATAVGAPFSFVDAGGGAVIFPAGDYGFDFNPTVDRIRVTTDSGLNFRINPSNGAPVDGDGNAANGTNPDGSINGAGVVGVSDNAYTNNQPNQAVTTLYTLDPATNQLFIQNPPNNGTQTVPVAITLDGTVLDFSAVHGFDIPAGVNVAAANSQVSGSGLALLTVGGTTGLYGIDLTTGAATRIGDFLDGATLVRGLAIQNDLGGIPAIGLSADGTQLLRFNTATPGTPTSVALSGVIAGETVVGVDFRPQTGQLYAFAVNATANTATLYLVDPQNGAATAVGTPGQIAFVDAVGLNPIDLPAGGYGMDFNPTVDRIRITTDSGLNFRINPNNGAAVDTDGNAANGINPDGSINGLPIGSTGVSANAYTNSFGQPLAGGVTTLYTLDAFSNSLFIQNPPNAGTLTGQVGVTLGGSALDFTSVNGFDIPAGVRVSTSNSAAAGVGFAGLTVGGVNSLYSINLVSGEATNLGAIGPQLAGLALADSPGGGGVAKAFRISLDGAQQVPSVMSSASGLGTAIFDSITMSMSITVNVKGLDWGPLLMQPSETPSLLDDVNGVHIHAEARGANGPIVLDWPAGGDADDFAVSDVLADGSRNVTSIWETTDANPITTFLTAFAGASFGADVPFYMNIHTGAFPGGEIRGQFVTIATDNGETVNGTAGDDILPGLGGGDALVGLAGNDSLDGGTGADAMFGGQGNDSYVVDAGDGVIENASEGADTVNASINYVLTANVENLILQGDAITPLQGYGNGLANNLTGSAGANLLNGQGGADTMAGGLGNDVYFVDDAGDQIVENGGGGNDVVFSSAHLRLSANVETLVLQGTTDLQGYGNSLNNLIYGNAGSNILDGDTGADSLFGGAGNDAYFVDSGGDGVIENASEGNDTVFSTDHLRLVENVENLILQGGADLQGYGNSLANILVGNTGRNLLNGDAGADTMFGGLGDDAYFVDNAGDQAIESPGEGADAIFSTVSQTLAPNVEILVLQGSADLNGTGNELGNQLYGNDGVNVLDGGAAGDLLGGGAGNDIFVFRPGEANGDVVTDFVGNGPGAGDALQFIGYGAATFENIDPTHWQVVYNGGASADVITFLNSPVIHPTDFTFI